MKSKHHIIYKRAKVIAEIGCNHMGDISVAKNLIKLAKANGADVAKFQKRNPKELLSPDQYMAPHPVPYHAFGSTYGAHREFLEFNMDQHIELKRYCERLGIGYSSSVWDITSAKQIIALNPKFIKVPSAANNHFRLLEVLCDKYRGDIHLSLGMTTREEENKIVALFEERKIARSRLILYACTSGYPISFDDVCLLEIVRLRDQYKNRVKGFGFSGHHHGISVDIAAYTLGVQWIERHFTQNRAWKGTDHAASLEPLGLQKLSRDLKAVYDALEFKRKEILDVEISQRERLKHTGRAGEDAYVYTDLVHK